MPEPRRLECELCRRTLVGWAANVCPMCGKTFCHKCAYLAYGRLFCSERCGDFFFHGDGEDEGDEDGEDREG